MTTPLSDMTVTLHLDVAEDVPEVAPAAQKKDLVMEYCDHLGEGSLNIESLVIYLGDARVLFLCRTCERGVEAGVLKGIVQNATREAVRDMLRGPRA